MKTDLLPLRCLQQEIILQYMDFEKKEVRERDRERETETEN